VSHLGEKTDLPEDLIFNVNYLGGNMPTFTLNFSRPGGQIIAQYYNFLRLGREGYLKIHQACYDTAQFFAAELVKLGSFEILYGGDPARGIPCVSWKLQDGAKVPFGLYDLADRLRVRGWQVPAYSHATGPGGSRGATYFGAQRGDARSGRVVARGLPAAMDYFASHPVAAPRTAEEGTGYHH